MYIPLRKCAVWIPPAKQNVFYGRGSRLVRKFSLRNPQAARPLRWPLITLFGRYPLLPRVTVVDGGRHSFVDLTPSPNSSTPYFSFSYFSSPYFPFLLLLSNLLFSLSPTLIPFLIPAILTSPTSSSLSRNLCVYFSPPLLYPSIFLPLRIFPSLPRSSNTPLLLHSCPTCSSFHTFRSPMKHSILITLILTTAPWSSLSLSSSYFYPSTPHTFPFFFLFLLFHHFTPFTLALTHYSFQLPPPSPTFTTISCFQSLHFPAVLSP